MKTHYWLPWDGSTPPTMGTYIMIMGVIPMVVAGSKPDALLLVPVENWEIRP